MDRAHVVLRAPILGRLPGCRLAFPLQTTGEFDAKRTTRVAVAGRGKKINRGREYENLVRAGGVHRGVGNLEPGNRLNRI